MRLLIVEDSPLIRKVTRLAFPSKEHQLVEADDGQMALALLDAASEPFDAILLDLNMPRMNGCQFMRALQDRTHHRDTPVVLATSERETSPLLLDAYALNPAAVVRNPGTRRRWRSLSGASWMIDAADGTPDRPVKHPRHD